MAKHKRAYVTKKYDKAIDIFLKTIEIICLLILLLPIVAFLFLKIDFNVGKYDIVLRCKQIKNSALGIDYKKKFDVWSIKGEGPNNIQYRIYPP